jgi:hypothetical protein
MRRLTLILSDLYLPEEAAPDATIQPLDLPHLDGLLRFARAARIADWRGSLAADLGRPDLVSAGAAKMAAHGLPFAHEPVWLATAVRFEARLDHVRMLDRGMPRLAAAERAEWCAEFARAFAPYALHDAGPRGFVLTGIAPAQFATVDPARLLDADIGRAQPSGAPARELRRLAAEMEMWMHGAPTNVARERAGLPQLSALWLWGGGPGAAASQVSPASKRLRFFGDDPAFAGLARALGTATAEVPAGFDALHEDLDRALIEVMPINGAPGESLPALDANWFAPVRAALNDGSLAEFDLIANDRWFRVAARPGWRIWRARKPWLTQLATGDTRAKA